MAHEAAMAGAQQRPAGPGRARAAGILAAWRASSTSATRSTPGMVTYKGLPGPVITDHLSREASRPLYAGGTTFQIGKIEMVANTGTYVDAPFHRWEDGADLSQLSLDFPRRPRRRSHRGAACAGARRG